MAWSTDYPVPPKVHIQHAGSISSSGKQTTTGANEVISFGQIANSVEITAHTVDINVKLVIAGTAETNSHLIQVGESRLFELFQLTGFVIVENGAQYSYTGGYY